MARYWACAGCGGKNRPGDPVCDGCGAERPTRTAGELTQPREDRRCRWITGGLRCLMRASVWPWPAGPGAQGVCGWHLEAQLGTRHDSFPAFAYWIESFQRHYCSTWGHYDLEALWAWVRGLEPREAIRRGPCAKPNCSERIIAAGPARDLATEAQSRAAGEIVQAVLGQTMALPQAHAALAAVFGGVPQDYAPGGRVEAGHALARVVEEGR